MPELRRNPLNGQWVIVAPDRAARPDTFHDLDTARAGVGAPAAGGGDEMSPGRKHCPFCPGNEGMTPPEVMRTGEGGPGTPGWRVRVFPNLYPMVDGDAAPVEATASRFHDAVPARGAHEVAVLSPDHHRSLADLNGVEAEELFDVLVARTAGLLAAGHEYVQVLVNHGKGAGASIEHPHTQLVAVGMPPPAVLDEAACMAAASEGPSEPLERGAQCPVCRAVAEDADSAAPLFVAGSPAPVWCPWWSGTPFEVMVAPRAHEPRFETSGGTGDVARSVSHAVALLRKAVGDVPYNVVVHTSPQPGENSDGGRGDFHWHVHIYPRMVVQAGFEMGTGILVNQVPPEHAASALRAAGTRSPSGTSEPV